MKRGTRDTIRRKPDYERDPDWDIGEVLDKRRKRTRREAGQRIHTPDEVELDEQIEREHHFD
ncbi:MAG: hypothetical protein WCS59_01375 [Sphaerochaetaceae bacterium]|jgi:hypothetical protein|nr:hypothetical protein [Sphaerochaetaceae bacterium]MDD3367219.1 hypothetical protein [Sphaerochaetaceae bacterium]MDD4218817.1 hypothetical protein [Sphaerochaetaceae bacterium]MDY0371255.1 hypothetical protein [Sphaerochaetaceae bacterium]